MLQKLGLQDDLDYNELNDDAPESVAEKVSNLDDYQRNRKWLTWIHYSAFSLSAIATGTTNALAHKDRIGLLGAIPLAIIIMCLVEAFYFTLRHGLTTVYQGSQRTIAKACYHIIQLTIILNMSLLCAWIVGEEPPWFLLLWNHWSIAVHGALGLIGVAWVSDSDWIIASRMGQLKAATDIEAIRRGASSGAGVIIAAAKIRGYLDAIQQAKEVFAGKKFANKKPTTHVPEEVT